jgi:hypothetical protein
VTDDELQRRRLGAPRIDRDALLIRVNLRGKSARKGVSDLSPGSCRIYPPRRVQDLGPRSLSDLPRIGYRPQPRVKRSATLGSLEKAIRFEGPKDSWPCSRAEQIDWVEATAADLSLLQSVPPSRCYPGLRFAPPWAEVLNRFAVNPVAPGLRSHGP